MVRIVINPATGLPYPDSASGYGYRPTESIAILFIVLFSISTVAHIGQATRHRTWFMFYTAVFSGLLEVGGWLARLWSSSDLFLFLPFELQIVATIIAPTPLVAADFVILGQIIRQLGPSYSRLSPRLYSIIFCSCDVVSLVIQALGGAMAASAANGGNSDKGGHVMLGGIVFQLVMITIYIACATEFLVRYIRDEPFKRVGNASKLESGQSTFNYRGLMTKEIKRMIAALVFNTTCLYIRSIYRTIELSDGWTGRIITTQVYFNVLDGAMIVLAIYTLNFVHPSILKKEDDDNLQNGNLEFARGNSNYSQSSLPEKEMPVSF